MSEDEKDKTTEDTPEEQEESANETEEEKENEPSAESADTGKKKKSGRAQKSKAAKTPKGDKSAKPRNKKAGGSGHPPTLQMVEEALEVLREPKGSSVQSIKNYIQQQFKSVRADMIKVMMKRALQQGLDKGVLVRPKNQSEIGVLTGRYKLNRGQEPPVASKSRTVKLPSSKPKPPAAKIKIAPKKSPKKAKKAAPKKAAESPKKSPAKSKPAAKKPAKKAAASKAKKAGGKKSARKR